MKLLSRLNSHLHTRLGHTLSLAKPYVWALAALAIIALMALLKVVGQFGTALIGRDSSASLWTVWWLSRATGLNFDWMIVDHVVLPFKQNLIYSLSPIASVLYGLQRLILIPSPIAFNLLYLVAFLFTGGSMLLYLRQQRIPWGVAFCGSALLSFSPIMFYYLSQGRPELMMLGWIPLGCWVWERIRHSNTQTGWGLAAVSAGVVLTSLQVSLWAWAIWLPYILITWRQSPAEERPRLLNVLLLQYLAIVFLYLIYPIPGILKTWVNIAPATQPIYLGQDWQSSLGFGLTVGLWLAGMALCIWRSPREKSGLTAQVWISLGCLSLLVAGLSQVGWLKIPGTAALDWFAPASVAFCAFLAIGLTQVWQAQRTSWVLLTIIGLVLASILQAPLPSTAWNASVAYDRIGWEGGDYAVLEIPFGIQSLATGQTVGQGAELQQYAVLHHHRVVSGITTSASPEPFQRYQSSPLWQYLGGTMAQPTSNLAQVLAQTSQDQRIGYIVLHLDQLTRDRQTSLTQFLSEPSAKLCKVFTDPTTIVYRTGWHPYGCLRQLE